MSSSTQVVETQDLARTALLDGGYGAVGTYIGAAAEDEITVTHRFETTLPGYQGWQWAVVIAHVPGAPRPTVSEIALLPGPESILSPPWIPWAQRIRPGDLGPGDLLAPPTDDPRVVPGFMANGDPEVDDLAVEVGLGRKLVISPVGRAEAAERWHESGFGPESDMAKAAQHPCEVCAFYLPIAGALHAAFGVCANEMGADGRVVHALYGCGAHSDTYVPPAAELPTFKPFDDAAIEVVTD